VAVAGLAFYTGKSSAWKDSVFIGLLNGRGVSRLKLVNNKVVEEEVMLTDRKARIRDVRMGNDGSILVVTDSGGTAMSVSPPATGQLLKLTPAR
jgi:glucose/arabinose dehydrogenase